MCSTVTSSELAPGGISVLSGIGMNESGFVVNNTSVVNPNIEVSNGIIHGINRVLIPESLQQQLAAQLEVAEIY
ncbi:MAG: hypothetical protein HC922_07000 [Leptolyngbyaceae cyanobacterium SM2_3_12]|nr:hypothetical protein [Leptolyngbyaceae cyanobacterium SM2_3_12]